MSQSHQLKRNLSPLFPNLCKLFSFGLSLELLIRFIFYLSTYWFAVLECGGDMRFYGGDRRFGRGEGGATTSICWLYLRSVDKIHLVCVYILFVFLECGGDMRFYGGDGRFGSNGGSNTRLNHFFSHSIQSGLRRRCRRSGMWLKDGDVEALWWRIRRRSWYAA